MRRGTIFAMGERRPYWYHWTLLLLCLLTLVAMGALNIAYGASPESRFYAIDDVVVRLLGAGMQVCAVGALLRRPWGYAGLIWLLGLSSLETAVTFDWGAQSLVMPGSALSSTVLFFGVQIALLAWLGGHFLPEPVKE